MAANVFESNKGRQNFQRISRLLIAGATTVGREIFDSIHRPATLDTVLADPAREAILKASRMTRPQWNKVYPSPGKYGKSKDWDLTLTQKMLRNVCGFTQPATGWDVLPPDSDHSREADLVRLKYYRNTIYGHVDERMEIKDEEFQKLWKEISEAIIRLAGHLSSAKKKEWEQAIEDFLTAPLTSDDILNVEELKDWYRQDVETREELVELKGEVSEIKELMKQFSPTKLHRDVDPTIDTCSLLHHEEQLREWFCEECQECVCRTCVALQHGPHPCINMNSLTHIETLTQELLQTSEKVRSKIHIHQNLIGNIKNDGALRNDKLEKVKCEVKLTVENWIKQLREQEHKTLKDIETTQNIYQENDDSQVMELEKHVENMETYVRYTENLANCGSTMEKVIGKNHAVNCSNDHITGNLKPELKTITGCEFIPTRNLLPNFDNIGTVLLWDCRAEGNGLHRATVGVTSSFTISTIAVRGTSRQTFYKPTLKMNVKIQCDYGDLSAIIHDHENGTYSVSFTPVHPGDHKISVTVDDYEIRSCTYTVKVNRCVLVGGSVQKGTVGSETEFVFSFQGPADEKVYDPFVAVTANIQSPQGDVTSTINDRKDGTYKVSFVATHPGPHEISIAVDCQDIPGCKYIATIERCILKAEGFTNGIVGLKSQFSIAFRGAGDVKVYDSTTTLNVKIQSPEGTIIPNVHDNKDGTYLVSFFPARRGEYRFSITRHNRFSEYESGEQVMIHQEELPVTPLTMIVQPREFQPLFEFGMKGAEEGQFDYPRGMTVNAKDEIIVADSKNHRIQVFTSTGELLRRFGKKGTELGEFDSPRGVVSDQEYNIIVLDAGNGRVQIFSEAGEFLHSFASKRSGNENLKYARGISLDNDENIIITNSRGRVQLFSREGEWLKSFDCGDGLFHCISHDDLYYVSIKSVAEHCIKAFDKSGALVSKYGTQGSSPGSFNSPAGLAVDKANHLVVCETSNHRVQLLNMDGTVVGSYGKLGTQLGEFRYPSSVAVMSDGVLVVCDSANNRIQILE